MSFKKELGRLKESGVATNLIARLMKAEFDEGDCWSIASFTDTSVRLSCGEHGVTVYEDGTVEADFQYGAPIIIPGPTK